VGKRFKEKSFAAGANRENIAKCVEIGLDLDRFIEIGVVAMKGIAGELGFS
jgi:predicted hydrolase (HD superfamily)